MDSEDPDTRADVAPSSPADTSVGDDGDVATDGTDGDAVTDGDHGGDWPRRLRHLGEAFAVLLGAYLFAVIAVRALDPALASVAPAADGNGRRIGRTVVQFLAIVAVSLWYADVVDAERLIGRAVPTARSVALILGGTVLLVVANVGVNRLLSAVGFESGENAAVTAGAGDPTYLLAMAVLSILLVGPAEELLFRGAIQGRLRASWGVWPAILGATVLFGAIHAPAVTGTTGAVVGYLITAGVLGLLLGYLYERTDNIVVPAAVHGGNNAVIFGLLYLAEVGVV